MKRKSIKIRPAVLCLLTAWIGFAPSLWSEEIILASSNIQQERKEEIRYLCRAFELYHPELTVTLLDYSDEEPETLYDGEGRARADVIMADSPILHSLNKQNLLDRESTDRLIRELGESSFYRGSLRAMYNGEQRSFVAVPYTAWLQLIWYRKDILDTAGIAPPASSTELLEAARTVQSQGAAPYGIVAGTGRDRYLLQCFYQLAGLPQRVNRSGTENISFYRSLTDTAPPGEMTWRARDFYFQDRAPFLVYSTHLMDDIAVSEIAADSLTDQYFPELSGKEGDGSLFRNTGFITTLEDGGKPVSFGSVSGWGIFARSDKKAAAEELIRFFFRNDVYISYMHMSPGGMLPVRADVLEDDNFFRDPQGVFIRFGKEAVVNLCQSIEYLYVLPESGFYTSEELHQSLWGN
ncbi:MAG: ABC transporter substrate-binding protein [Spirochaetales bacterium]|nr:ABC transporter substrate-binding protein [Spirochaetales bacterium]